MPIGKHIHSAATAGKEETEDEEQGRSRREEEEATERRENEIHISNLQIPFVVRLCTRTHTGRGGKEEEEEAEAWWVRVFRLTRSGWQSRQKNSGEK